MIFTFVWYLCVHPNNNATDCQVGLAFNYVTHNSHPIRSTGVVVNDAETSIKTSNAFAWTRKCDSCAWFVSLFTIFRYKIDVHIRQWIRSVFVVVVVSLFCLFAFFKLLKLGLIYAEINGLQARKRQREKEIKLNHMRDYKIM